MDLSIYIKELLLNHNCVIIPGFGAFVLNYKPAEVNPVLNSFSPPSKDIIFNQSIRHNDGLLTDIISARLKITYEEASFILKDSVEDLKISITKGKNVIFRGLGVFSQSREGKYIFEYDSQLNLNLNSFGLADFYSPAIKREGLSKRLEKKLKENQHKHREMRVPASVGWTAAASIIIISIFGWLSLNTDVLRNINFSYSGYINNPAQHLYNDNTIKPELLNIKPETGNIKQETRNKKQETVKPEPETLNPKPEKQNPEPETIANCRYYIIGGCFSIAENADKFVNELKAKGFDASIIGKTKTGLIRVAYNCFENAEDANSSLEKIRSSENPHVWLLHQ